MAKKNLELEKLTQDWHDNVKDDTPNEKFVPKRNRVAEEPDYEEVPVVNANGQSPAQTMWVDDWTLLKEVTKTNREVRGQGANRKFVTSFFGELK